MLDHDVCKSQRLRPDGAQRTRQRRRLGTLSILLLLWLVPSGRATSQAVASTALPSSAASAPFAVMQEALQHALHLRFAEALEAAAQLEEQQQPTLASRLTAGMIAYFQARWQTYQSASPRHTGHKLLQGVLE